LSQITKIVGREIIDSRGEPTIEVDVYTSDGSLGRAAAPSGSSTGSKEAKEKRDRDGRFYGKGVLKAVKTVADEIEPAIVDKSVFDQVYLDEILISIDGTQDKSRLGGNTLVAISLAIAKAGAASKSMPLFKYLNQDISKFLLPCPMLNIINGGRHAVDSVDVQEFMVVPAGFQTFAEALRAGAEIFQALKVLLRDKGMIIGLGDEGGFSTQLDSNKDALEVIVDAIEKANYKPGKQCFIALDVAATELLEGESNRYKFHREDLLMEPSQLLNTYRDWVSNYPIISIEDGFSEYDWDSWGSMVRDLGGKIQIVGDDLFTTNPKLIDKGIKQNVANAVLIKPNQIGTLTETINAVRAGQKSNWGTILSHRSGETEDTSIVDLAIGLNAGQIKTGAPSRGERVSKYNKLLRIEQDLGQSAIYSGFQAYQKYDSVG
tara:strand:- start:239 stop:1537 length:1299 start_codon:yes stop_codon:yes gene_type:complete